MTQHTGRPDGDAVKMPEYKYQQDGNRSYSVDYREPAAPPKPAPDALREALERLPEEVSENALWALASALHSNVPEEKRPMSWSDFSPEQIERLHQAANAFFAALSAPVPSGEGTKQCPHGNPLSVWCPYCQPSPSPAVAAEPVGYVMRIKDEKCFYWERGVAEWKAREFEDKLSATATIDPVFFHATPPVKGDRERFDALLQQSRKVRNYSHPQFQAIPTSLILNEVEAIAFKSEATPSGKESAGAVEVLVAALEFIRDGYANQDVSHVDYRVKVYQVALDALEKAAAHSSTNCGSPK